VPTYRKIDIALEFFSKVTKFEVNPIDYNYSKATPLKIEKL
jgi:hypothetical protein